MDMMNKNKSYKKKQMRHSKVILLILILCLIVFPSKYGVSPSHLNHTSDGNRSREHFDGLDERMASKIITPKKDLQPQRDGVKLSTPINNRFVITTLISVVISTCLMSMLLGYLHGVAFDKRGTLLYLYKDAIRIFICLIWLWLMVVITCNLVGSTLNNDKLMAKFFAYSFMALIHVLEMTLSIMGILRLYMLKERMLDPPMPWDGEENDEGDSITKIRLSILLMTVGYIATLIILGVYPKTYYNLIGDMRSFKELPIGTSVILSINIAMVIIYAALFLRARLYQDESTFNPSRKFPHQLHFLPFTYLLLIWIYITFLILMTPGTGYVWSMLQLLFAVAGVCLPGYLILVVEPLRTYAKRRMENQIRLVIVPCITFICLFCRNFKRNSPTVEPII